MLIVVEKMCIRDSSYIGRKSAEVKVPANGQISVMLKEDSQLMDDVVVTGYGDFKKAT